VASRSEYIIAVPLKIQKQHKFHRLGETYIWLTSQSSNKIQEKHPCTQEFDPLNHGKKKMERNLTKLENT
jgi:hypothetical protein